MGIWKLNTAGPRSSFDRPFPALRVLSIVVVSGEYIAPDSEGVDGNFAGIKGEISWLTRNQNKNFLSPCTYLFSWSLAWGSLILATSLLAVLLVDVRFSFPKKMMFRGVLFASPFPCHSLSLPSKTQVWVETPGLREDIMSLRKRMAWWKALTCRYHLKERKF